MDWYLQLTPYCSCIVLLWPVLWAFFVSSMQNWPHLHATWYMMLDFSLSGTWLLTHISYIWSVNIMIRRQSWCFTIGTHLSSVLNQSCHIGNKCPLLWALQLVLLQYWACWLSLQMCLDTPSLQGFLWDVLLLLPCSHPEPQLVFCERGRRACLPSQNWGWLEAKSR